MKCLALSRYPHSDPLLGTALTTAKLAEGWLSVFWQKKKDFIATIECGKIRQKPRYTVNEVSLTKNSLRAPFVARNNSLLRLHGRPTLCGSKKVKQKHKVSHFYFYFCQKIRTYFVHFHTFSYIFKVQRTPTEFGPPVTPLKGFLLFYSLKPALSQVWILIYRKCPWEGRGDTPLYGLYGDVPLDRVWSSSSLS